jgi:hypothetical protein
LGAIVSRQFTLQVVNASEIETTALKVGKVGRFYRVPFRASGGRRPYTWSLVSGAIPAGLAFNASGTLRGTPTSPATVDLTFQVADPLGGTKQKTLTLTINP